MACDSEAKIAECIARRCESCVEMGDIAQLAADLAAARERVRLQAQVLIPSLQTPVVQTRLLTAQEAARITGMTARWFYERADSLPFARRPSPRRLRFDERRLREWMEHGNTGSGARGRAPLPPDVSGSRRHEAHRERLVVEDRPAAREHGVPKPRRR